MGFKIKKTVNGETVWEPIKAKKYTASKITEHTGALPITINANGQPLLDYRIYGNTVQTGTPTPENPIMPSGCGEKTENLFNQNESEQGDGYVSNRIIGAFGGLVNTTWAWTSEYISITPETDYCWFSDLFRSTTYNYIAFYTAQKEFIKTVAKKHALNPVEYAQDNCTVFTAPANAYYMRVSIDRLSTMNLLTAGSTAPSSYIPYGYKLPMTVSDGNTVQTIPVYIGESQLAESEYVSYSEGKIYHKNPANYFDGYFELGAIDYNTGAEVPAYSALRTDFIELEPSNRYYFKWATGNLYIIPVSYDENKNYVRYLGAKSTNPSYFDLGANEKYIRFYLYNTTTPPKEMMVCKNANAPYYDPQDPPVPLPQIPTIKGETVIDYDGTPKPSQMYVKYNSWSGWSDINNYKMVNGDWTQEMI